MSPWMVDPATFSHIVRTTYLVIAIFLAIYIAEFAIIAIELGFSKRLTLYSLVGFMLLLIGYLLSSWSTAIYTYPTTVVTEEGVEVTKTAIESTFVVFPVPILLGLIICLIVALLIVKTYIYDIRLFRRAEDKKSTAEEVKSDIIARRGRVHSDSETIKDVKDESEEYIKRHEEIKSRW